MAKTGAFYFYSKNEVKKLLEQKDFENAWKVGSLLSFVRSLRCVFTFAVFYRRNKVALRRAVVTCNAIFFSFVCLICSSFGCITKHLMSGPSGN